MTSPYPGLAVPAPRTWSLGDIITTPRLRGDMTNLAELFCGGRPLLYGRLTNATATGQPGGSPASNMPFTSTNLNNWNVQVLTTSNNNALYTVPLTGWYLIQGSCLWQPSGDSDQNRFATGISLVQSGVTSRVDGGVVTGNTTTGSHFGAAAADLQQMTAGDTIAVYGFQDTNPNQLVWYATISAEWVGAFPGNVVAGGLPAAATWPSGPGAYITNSGGITAGATSVTVSDATGMVTGGVLGLDVNQGQLAQPYAEAVTISGVAGTTIGISATSYAHAQNAPVAVPVSPAFLNSQVRDMINFLGYPPMVRAAATTTQSLSSQSFPSGTQITHLSSSGGIDNYGGFSSNAYTAPSAGVYLIYGQVYYAGSTSTFTVSAGVQQNSGTIQWGSNFRTNTSSTEPVCAWIVRHLRLSAGDTIKLYGFQNSGSAMSTIASTAQNSRLICIWRSA